ncbi:MAG: flagellar protein FliS, partial [Eubacterium sp.]|nr:flagellar protein FliS [Eubacterium sp.]
DMKYPVAQDFENIYVYLSRRLMDVMASKDPAIMEEIVTHLRSVRDNWKEVMKKAKAS